jgi:transcription termination factor NusB
VARTPVAGDKGPLANPKVLAALFSSDATEKMRNTEAVEFGPNQLVSVRVVKHYPEKTLPLDQVTERATALWKAEQALKMAKAEALAKLADGKADKPVANLGAVQTLSREQNLQLPAEVVEAVMRAVLRAATYELKKRKDIPGRVVITEYVDVAAAFLGRDETGMINAVLDKIARELRAEEFSNAS